MIEFNSIDSRGRSRGGSGHNLLDYEEDKDTDVAHIQGSSNFSTTLGDRLSTTSSFYCHNFSCTSGETSNCQQSLKIERCPKEVKTCFAIWTNDSEHGVKALHKGCWNVHAANCQRDECEATGLSSTKEQGQETYFCCCESSGCNAHIALSTTRKFSESSFTVPSSTTSRPSSSEISLLSMLTLIFGIFIFAVLIIVLYFIYRRLKIRYNDGESGEEKAKLPSFNESSHQQIMFEVKSLISRGRFGSVYQATLENCDLVAVKIFPVSEQDSWIQEQDIYNTPLMSCHENILHFIAVDVNKSDPREYRLFTTFLENGSLHDYLKSHTVTFKEMMHISSTVLKGLSFLHEEKYCNDGRYKPIICHRDFKTRNILLKKDLTACISDFGLAIKCGYGRIAKETHGQVGTRRYMAPEVLQGATEFSATAFKQIDIYAAALVLWEVLSRCIISNVVVGDYKLPYEKEVGLKPSLEEMYEVVVVKSMRPIIKDEWLRNVTIQEMWDSEFEARLTAGGALQRFLAVDQPINSVSCSSLSYNDRSSSHHETTPLIDNDLIGRNSSSLSFSSAAMATAPL
uniref:Serine/threonine-protein kinase receptor n=1 Tax=Romanomermis culicivorax TaxID=13658 RepID=A0A915IQH7_ROMCU